MSNQDISIIVYFINNEIKPYDLNLKYYINDDVLYATFEGFFTSHRQVELSFRYKDKSLQIYGPCEDYISCGTREFWIELMTRLID